MKRVIKIGPSVVDGIGLRVVVYFSGCSHQCPGCHNPESWDSEVGIDYGEGLVKEVIDVMTRVGTRSLTLSGGDPLYGSDEEREYLNSFLKSIRPYLDSLWMYTGYTYDTLIRLPNTKQIESILSNVDVLVDGRFVKLLRDPALQFRGSRNQRIINMSMTRSTGKVVEMKI
jgi:anaerobic ribonucleoside-triphosphate reductase activating protein